MKMLRLGAAATTLGLALLANEALAATHAANCNSAPTTALGTALAASVAGDLVAITGICTQDVTVTVSGLTITNDTGLVGSGFIGTDGVQGQFELAGATGIVIDGILLGAASSFSFAAATDVAVLYAHDGAAATVSNSNIENSPLLGVLAARSAKVELHGGTVSNNGGGTSDQVPRDNGGLQARDNGAIVLGVNDGSAQVTVSNNPFDAVAAYRDSSLVIYSASLTGNSAHQVVLTSASSANLSLAATSITAPSGAPDAILVTGTSTLQIAGGVSLTGASGQEAILLTGGSALLLQGSMIAAAGKGPVIEASSGSAIALAGGNSICNGTFSDTTCEASTGIALEIDHVASLVQVAAAAFGYTAAADSVTGSGSASLQSTVDLGLGSGQPLNWTTGANGIAVAQNSSFRLEGGVTISGNINISQGSNGFFNTKYHASNFVGQVVCSWTVIPAAHVAAAGNAGTNPSAVTPFPVLSTHFLSTTANQCLSF